MARTFVAKDEEIEAWELRAGQTFERKSVSCRVFGAPMADPDDSDYVLVAVLAEHPNGGGGQETLRLHARLAVQLTGQYE